jgi:outer membrane scaffolding protein for murein synthesis (MipA/OmpV family)
MIGEAIGFFYAIFQHFLFAAAVVFATLLRDRGGVAERLLAWMLLLPIGVTGLSVAKSATMASREFPRRYYSIISKSVSPIEEQERVATWQASCGSSAGAP